MNYLLVHRAFSNWPLLILNGQLLIYRFEDRGDALPRSDAHRRQAEFRLAIEHRVDQRGGDAGAAGPQGVPDGDRAAADVYFFGIDAEQLHHGQDLHGKRFVDLDQVDVRQLQAGPFENLERGWNRADAHDG